MQLYQPVQLDPTEVLQLDFAHLPLRCTFKPVFLMQGQGRLGTIVVFLTANRHRVMLGTMSQEQVHDVHFLDLENGIIEGSVAALGINDIEIGSSVQEGTDGFEVAKANRVGQGEEAMCTGDVDQTLDFQLQQEGAFEVLWTGHQGTELVVDGITLVILDPRLDDRVGVFGRCG